MCEIDSITFIQNFPEFSDLDVFPQGKIDFWLGVAKTVINQSRWGRLYDQGVQLLTAHYLSVDANGTLNKTIPGLTDGIDTGQTVDVESYTLEVNAMLLEGAGLFNKTSYGIQYWQFAKMRGIGPLSALSYRRY